MVGPTFEKKGGTELADRNGRSGNNGRSGTLGIPSLCFTQITLLGCRVEFGGAIDSRSVFGCGGGKIG